MFGLLGEIFVDAADFAEVAEVPVKFRAGLLYFRGDAGHDHVAAVTRIA
jgi:hypothetical protein